jgi:hypothetical protein
MNKNKKHFRFLSLLLVTVLLAAMVFTMVSCNNDANDASESSNEESTSSIDAKKVSFSFEVVFADGKTETYDIETDKKTVGEALLEKGMISGEDGQFGLYVKTVCGETHDYDTDATYWSFYVNDEISMTGVDATDIVEGTKYSFKAEK